MSDEVTGRSDHAAAPASWQYPFNFSTALTIEPDSAHSGYVCRAERTFAAATPAWGLSQADVAAARSHIAITTPPPPALPPQAGEPVGSPPDEGVAEAFVELLRHSVVPPVPGFKVVRLVPPPEASGERTVDHEGQKDFVVVGERVVVTWMRTVRDADHAAPRVHTHLDAVDFFGVPETYGILLWIAPSGREVPVAWATKYLPRAHDGWVWCVDLAQRALGLDGGGPPDPWVHDFPARIGRHIAKLHVALATPSRVIGTPTAAVDADLVRAWHSVASQTVEHAAAVAKDGHLEGAADLLLPRLGALQATVDGLLDVAEELEAGSGDPVLMQTIHGDLHVGQVLRWPSGLAVVDFHPDPALEFRDLKVGQAYQPAARDLARLLRSLDHVGRVVDKMTGFAETHSVDRWSRDAREQLLSAYRSELAGSGHPELLDVRLIAPFEAEQLCREIVYAAEHLPSWGYAPLGGLWQEYRAEDQIVPTGRHGRHSAPDDWP